MNDAALTNRFVDARASFSLRSLPWLLLLVVLPAYTPLTAQSASETASLRVMTFNIRYGTAPDGENAWVKRSSICLRTIGSANADIIGVQEAIRSQIEAILEVFPEYAQLGVGRDDGRMVGEYSAIFVKKERFDILASGTFWLSDTPEVPGSMSWGNLYPRICSWARMQDALNGYTIAVFNTHWDHESQAAREKGALLIRERVRSIALDGDRVILMGDFNAGESNPAFVSMLGWPERPLRDSFRMLHPDEKGVGTYNAFRERSNSDKIDAILVSEGWRVLNAEIDRISYEGKMPSDHFPVTATLAPLQR